MNKVVTRKESQWLIKYVKTVTPAIGGKTKFQDFFTCETDKN